MKPKALLALTCVNTVAVVGLVAGHALVDRDPPRSAAAPDVAALAARVEALEARLARVEPVALAPPPSAAAGPAAGEASDEAPASITPSPAWTSGDPGALVTRGEVEAIVRATLGGQQAGVAKEKAEAAAAKGWERPRRTLEEAARELQLDAHQTTQLRELYRGLERQSMRVLFGLPEDADLEPLKAQLARSEHDPALKDALREQVAVNWARHSAEISVLWVQFDARLRRLLPADAVARLYALDVRQDAPEFPDIKDMFFGGEKKE
ncbi:MAG: hypothetical protein M9894_11520 [Planctomycetes bacterium]|nr:hypothetical protein [Planctomycetota bacterium]